VLRNRGISLVTGRFFEPVTCHLSVLTCHLPIAVIALSVDVDTF
jgi:hypothetical protein